MRNGGGELWSLPLVRCRFANIRGRLGLWQNRTSTRHRPRQQQRPKITRPREKMAVFCSCLEQLLSCGCTGDEEDEEFEG